MISLSISSSLFLPISLSLPPVHSPNPKPIRQDDACELVSVLLHAMCKADALSAEHICEALDALLARISDLRLDAPDAPLLLGKFIARAVADDCIPGSYVMDHETPEDSHAIAALAKAAALLSVPNAPAHLAHVSRGKSRRGGR